MKKEEILEHFSNLTSVEKQSLLKALQELSPVMLDENTCLPLVYKNSDGTDEVSWEIMSGRKIEGILSAGLVFALENEKEYLNHKDALEVVQSRGLDLHHPSKHWDIFAEVSKFDVTVEALEANGISAEKWNKDVWYWTNSSVLSDSGLAYVSSMLDGGLRYNGSKRSKYAVRGCRALKNS